jgi:hypothetical protein
VGYRASNQGDGTNDKGNTPNAQHTYGVITLNYTVNLFLINDCGDSTLVTRSLTEAGIPDAEHDARIYPNPTQGELNIVFDRPVVGTLYYYSATGALLGQLEVNDEGSLTLDLSALPSGTYWLRWQGEDTQWNQSIVKP